MIDAEKFLNKLLYMGYMDEEKSEVEEVANRMTEDIYTKDDMVAMLKDLKKDIDKLPIIPETSERFKLGQATAYDNCEFLIQQKINKLEENEDGNK
jgi:hypothetical protein